MLAALLRELADFERSPDPRYPDLTFFQGQKVDMRLKYAPSDLVGLRHIEDLAEELTAQADKEPRRQIFVRTLVDTLAPVESPDRFRHLLREFGRVYDSYTRSHQLYMEDFSFEEVRSAFEEKKVAFVKELHGVVTDAQSKLVAIPLAFLVVAASLNPEDGVSLPNVVLLLGAVLFSFLLDVLVRNQKDALEAIKADVDLLRDRYTSRADSPLAILNRGFSNLDNQYAKQKTRLKILQGVVWSVALTAAILFAVAAFGQSKGDPEVSAPTEEAPVEEAPAEEVPAEEAATEGADPSGTSP